MHILMVCSGNICRSPLAEAAAIERFRDEEVTITSAGTVAIAEQHATPLMRQVATEHGLDLSSHQATPLRLADQPDLVLGMEQEHLVAARRAFPELPASRIRLLDHPHGVADPYGRGLDDYRASAAQIISAVERLDPIPGADRT